MRSWRADVYVFRTEILKRSCDTERVNCSWPSYDLYTRYVELLENRVEILETGLREALLHLNGHGGIRLPHSPSSNPPSPSSANYLEQSHDLNYNITQALKELQAMKAEREKGLYSENEHDSDHSDHSDHGGEIPSSRRDSDESTVTVSSAKTEDLATPLTSPSNSPIQKTLFLPTGVSQPPVQPQHYSESGVNFFQPYFDRNSSNGQIMAASFPYEELNLSWLDSIALDDSYDLSLQAQGDYPLMNL